MDIFLLFIKGLGVGIAVAAPVGPIGGVLCVRRTLDFGVWTGLLSGLGAAGAEAFYGAVAAFGVTAISALLLDYQDHLRLGGGAFLLILGAKTFISPLSEEAAAPPAGWPGPSCPVSC